MKLYFEFGYLRVGGLILMLLVGIYRLHPAPEFWKLQWKSEFRRLV
jgi:hypothetical protein